MTNFEKFNVGAFGSVCRVISGEIVNGEEKGFFMVGGRGGLPVDDDKINFYWAAIQYPGGQYYYHRMIKILDPVIKNEHGQYERVSVT